MHLAATEIASESSLHVAELCGWESKGSGEGRSHSGCHPRHVVLLCLWPCGYLSPSVFSCDMSPVVCPVAGGVLQEWRAGFVYVGDVANVSAVFATWSPSTLPCTNRWYGITCSTVQGVPRVTAM